MLTVYIKLKSNKYDKAYAENQVRNLIGEFFANIVSDQFIPKSDIEKLILDKVKGVESVNCYFLSAKNETALQTRRYYVNKYEWDPIHRKYNITQELVYLNYDEDPNLGLDAHGNIELSSDHEFPVLMGGWDWINNEEDQGQDTQEVTVVDPLNIIFI